MFGNFCFMTKWMFRVALVWVGAGSLPACTRHEYAAPVVAVVPTSGGTGADVAWVVEDGVRIVRCVNGPDRPICRRAQVD
jgi:hypothetical protein